MKKYQSIQRTVCAFICSLSIVSVLAGCSSNAKVDEKLIQNTHRVENQVGSDDGYEGVICPQLDAEYTQSEADQKKYDPIMQDILENGIDTEKELQTGL